jgi:hypothetical protein
MANVRDDLRATQEAIAREADELKRLEAEKARLDPADPRVDTLSDQAVRLAGRLEDMVRAERSLSQDLDPADPDGTRT